MIHFVLYFAVSKSTVEELQQQAGVFKRNANELKKKMWWKNIKVTFFLVKDAFCDCSLILQNPSAFLYETFCYFYIVHILTTMHNKLTSHFCFIFFPSIFCFGFFLYYSTSFFSFTILFTFLLYYLIYFSPLLSYFHFFFNILFPFFL